MSATPFPNPPRNISQPQRVVDGVAERIRDGVLKPGDRVPTEPELMREFGVSRTVVREAMSRLQASGMVATRQGVGTFVLEAAQQVRPLLNAVPQQVRVQQVLAMLELRISLESEAASLAAQRRGNEHLTAMRAALDAFDAQRRAGLGTTQEDFAFHLQIAKATGNEYFEEVLRNLGSATIPRPAVDSVATPAGEGQSTDAPAFGAPLVSLEHNKQVTQREHEDIFEAIQRQDPMAARASMLMHLLRSRERLRAISAKG